MVVSEMVRLSLPLFQLRSILPVPVYQLLDRVVQRMEESFHRLLLPTVHIRSVLPVSVWLHGTSHQRVQLSSGRVLGKMDDRMRYVVRVDLPAIFHVRLRKFQHEHILCVLLTLEMQCDVGDQITMVSSETVTLVMLQNQRQ